MREREFLCISPGNTINLTSFLGGYSISTGQRPAQTSHDSIYTSIAQYQKNVSPLTKVWSGLLIFYINRPISQIPECICAISHNAPFVTEMCTRVHISVTKWCIVGFCLMHCGICEIGLLKRHWMNGNFTWWRHQIKTFSALLALCAGNSPVTGEFPAQRPVTRSFDVSLICVRINAWVNNREAGDLRRHRAHYDVIVMEE